MAPKLDFLVAFAVGRRRADDLSALTNEVGDAGRVTELEVVELVGAVDEEAKQWRLFHQQAVVVRFRQVGEINELVGMAEHGHLRSLYLVVVESQHLVQHPHLREQLDGERLEEVTSELPVEVGVTLQ